MTIFNIDILGVAETHWTNETEAALEIGKHIITNSCRKDHIHCQGLAIMLKKELVNKLEGYNLKNERVMMIQLITAQKPLHVFQI